MEEAAEVSTDNKPVLICSPIRAITLNGSAKKRIWWSIWAAEGPLWLQRTLEKKLKKTMLGLRKCPFAS